MTKYAGYIDLRFLDPGTRFHVINGDWTGTIFSKGNERWFLIEDTGEDRKITGNEGLCVEILESKRSASKVRIKSLISKFKKEMLNLQEGFPDESKEDAMQIISQCLGVIDDVCEKEGVL